MFDNGNHPNCNALKNQVLDPSYNRRRMEQDAMNPDESERCFTDEDMWKVHEEKVTY